MEALLIIIGLLTAAFAQITAAAVLFRRHTNLALFSYLIYLVLWDLFAVAEFVFIYFSRFIPKSGRLGYLLFMGILWIMVNGFTVIFFADFISNWLRKRLSWIYKILLFLPFLIIQVTYTRRAVYRLIQEPEPALLQVTAPYSVKLMFLLILLLSVYAVFAAAKSPDPFLKKNIRLFSLLTIVSLFAFYLFLYSPPADMLNYLWLFASASFLSLGVNVPGFFVLRNYYKRQGNTFHEFNLAESRSRLKDQYNLSTREVEIISLVLEGCTNRDIAARAHISLETVKKHIYNTYKKIGVKNRLQLITTLVRDTKKE